MRMETSENAVGNRPMTDEAGASGTIMASMVTSFTKKSDLWAARTTRSRTSL